jgi:3-deoxy-D-manno-octulosonic-acid transferase
MGVVLNISYLVAAVAIFPFWIYRKLRARSLRDAICGRMGPWSIPVQGSPGRVLIHAVSVGEVNAASGLTDRLCDGGFDIVLSVTTETGFHRAVALASGRFPVVRSPLDLSWVVRRFLDGVAPTVVVLVELEVWPNFMRACVRRSLPVLVVNGRLSDRSIRRYRWIKRFLSGSFRSLHTVLAQSETSRDRFVELGVPSDRVMVSGNMKWDAAHATIDESLVTQLAEELGIDRTRPVIVAGSTEPIEHTLLQSAVPSGVQLIVAPRRPEWFDGAALAFPGCRRRSTGEQGEGDVVILDSIGELATAYALADVVVVGRSFGIRHGSDPMQPAAMGKAIVIGPAVSDFSDAVSTLAAADGISQVNAEDLCGVLSELITDEPRRRAMGEAAERLAKSACGATATSASVIEGLMRAQR